MPLDPPLATTTRAAFHPLRIAAIHRETTDAIAVELDIPEPLRTRFAFTPGQYLTLRTTIGTEEIRRSYSICSGLDDPHLRIAIKRVDDGQFSTWAHQSLHPGHLIEAMPPAGRFILPPSPPDHLLAIAAGSGITPILSIIKSALTRHPATRITLLYGSRSTASILFRDELEELKDRFIQRLAVTHILSRERQDIPILNGRLDTPKITALLPNPRPDLAFLCGPTPLIEAATQALQAAGLPPTSILSERFTPAGEPVRTAPRPTPPPSSLPWATATVIADGAATRIPLREGEPVLDAALRAGLDLPYSCRAGMCSTCRARITEGTATMAVNYGLEPWETKSGYVLTCQCHPTSQHLTVDYDQV